MSVSNPPLRTPPEHSLNAVNSSRLDAAPSLQHQIEGRALRSILLTSLTWICALLASVPLFSVLYMLITRGGARLNLEIFTELPPAGFEMGGGFGNALVGTFVMVGIAALIAIPVGIMAAIFLAELGPYSKLAAVARFAAKTLTGLPSILAGVFAYATVVLTTGTYSAPAGGVALAVLMVPIVVLTAEEAMKMVPKIMKDAAYGMGSTKTQVIWKVVLPTATPAILTGVMLAVARAAGETAPLLFTALFSNYWIYDGGHLAAMSPTASLAVLIYNFSGMPFDNQLELAWAASLVLVLIVLVVNVVSRIVGKPKI